MYQLAIFDLDGTLINSIQDLANAINFSLEQMHYPTHPLNAFYHFVGNGVPKLCQRALPDSASPEDIADLLNRFNTYYQAHCMDCTRPYDGIPEVLEQCRKNGILLAVASNKSNPFVQKIVHTLFPGNPFDLILGASNERPKKPAPDMVLHIMNTFHVSPAQTIYIGDSNVDIQTAKNAGVTSVGCVWGFRGKNELVLAGADLLADTPSNLSQFLLS